MLLYLDRPFYNILLPHIKIYFDGYMVLLFIVLKYLYFEEILSKTI